MGNEGPEVGVTPVGEEDMEWMKDNFTLEQLNASIDALGTEEVRGDDLANLVTQLSPLHLYVVL